MNRSTPHAFEPKEIMAYLDGELEATQGAALANHLEHCAECQAAATELRQVSERLLEFEIEPCPSKVESAVLSTSEHSGPGEKKRETGSHWTSSAAWFGKLMPQSAIGWAGIFGAVAIVVIGAAALLTSLTRPDGSTMNLAREQRSYIYQPKAGLTLPESSRGAHKAGGGGGIIGSKGPEAAELDQADESSREGDGIKAPEIRGPMIVENASITILAQNYDEASGRLQPLTAAHSGYVQDMTAETRTGTARSVSATLRVPAAQLEGFLADLRKLGHVEQETRNNQEVTDAYIDLTARLKTARATEQRILQLLATRTGKLSEVIEAEQELARIRGEIESMDGEQAHMEHQVDYATVQVELNEAYREQLNPESFSTGRRLRNSLVEGLGNLTGGITGLALFVFAYGPSIIFWMGLFAVPAWFIWRRMRRKASEKA